MRVLIAILLPLAAFSAAAHEQPLPIIPRPVQLERDTGEFVFSEGTAIRAEAALHFEGEYLSDMLGRAAGFDVALIGNNAEAEPDPDGIVLALDASLGHLGKEGYLLSVTPERIVIRAAARTGVFYAIQTLRQLLPPEIESSEPEAGASWSVPCVRIEDYPRFMWRGCMLDSARHFQDKAFVKRFIDLLAYYKMNRLHWHLTDDQGWRIEIESRPKLTEVGAWRPNANARLNYLPKDPSDHYGGFHTQDDLREIVAYAAARGVTVVPEIEMPGHCLAALMSYPELSCTGQPEVLGDQWIYPDVFCAGNEETFAFIEEVLAEVVDIFPSPWIHIGGDECPKTRWKACSKCQARIQAEGLADEDELQSYFVRRVEGILHAHGRSLIGWDEIIEGGLPPRAIVQSWRGMEGGLTAASQGHDAIMSPTSHCYLDYSYDRTPVSQTYSFEPIPEELDPSKIGHILGVECCMWLGNVSRRHLEETGEILPPSGIFYQVFPRLIALSEVGWSPEESRDWKDFAARLNNHGRRLDRMEVNFHRDPAVWPEE